MDLSNLAQGRWHGILTHLGIAPSHLRNRKGPCPGCGGVDRFRWDDKEGRGTFYCGGGGDPLAGDGFGLVKHIFHCEFPEAARMVEEALGGKQSPQIPRRAPPPSTSPTLSKARRIWLSSTATDEVVASHPYCQLKRIDRAYGTARGMVSGAVVGMGADCIIVPLKSPGGTFKGVEVIGAPVWDAEKQKHSTPKQTFGSKGCLILGNTLDKSLPVYIVEGFADAVSIWRMKGNVVAVAVFGGFKRQEFYANLFEQKNPNRRYIILEEVA